MKTLTCGLFLASFALLSMSNYATGKDADTLSVNKQANVWYISGIDKFEFLPDKRVLRMELLFQDDLTIECVQGDMQFCPPVPVSNASLGISPIQGQETIRTSRFFTVESAKAGEVCLKLSWGNPTCSETISLQVEKDIPFNSENLASIEQCHEQLRVSLQQLKEWGHGSITDFSSSRDQSRQPLFQFTLLDGTIVSYNPETKCWLHQAPDLDKPATQGNIDSILEALDAIHQRCQTALDLREHLRQRSKAYGQSDVLRSIKLTPTNQNTLLHFLYDKGYDGNPTPQLHFTWDEKAKQLKSQN